MSELAMTVLRRMLDERGVNIDTHSVQGTEYMHWTNPDGHWCTAAKYNPTDLCVCILSATPEQAVEATLGRGECNAVYKPEGVVCSECGGGGLTVPRLGVKALRNFCPNCGQAVKWD